MEVDDKFDRFNGYQQALAEADIEFNPDWVEEVPLESLEVQKLLSIYSTKDYL
ncbi:hypothetical protein [Photobacterium damselae]|uniref:hypothetical protein n=1 Tax=Photobacterium damselae TaxID=38293 RepID=UPI001E2BBFA9|nr:hypothetical protein [Photobacterium damselae]